MSYPERNLKIEYKRLKHEPNGNKSVGERRNFCFTEMGVPIFLAHWINRDYHNNVTPKIIWHQWYNNYALFLRTGRRGRRPLQLWILLIRIPPLNTFIPARKSDFRPAILHNELYNMLSKSSCDLIDIVQPYKNHINDLKWLEFCEKGAKI